MKMRLRRSSTFFEDPSTPEAELEDAMLEPLAPGPICASVNEVLEDEAGSILRLQKQFADMTLEHVRHDKGKSPESIDSRRRSIFRDSKAPSPVPILSPEAISQSNEKNIDYMDMDSSFTGVYPNEEIPAQKQPLALLLPAEILHKFYLYLAPSDFNSARHACRSWYINSLDCSLLATMLKRGGWYSSVQREIFENDLLDPQIRMDEEWLMSKHLARECALGPDWTGNGVSSLPSEKSPAFEERISRQTPFRLYSKTDFTNAGTHYPGPDFETCGMLFTVSACTKFLMVAHGCVVFVYELNRSHRTGRADDKIERGAIRPITSIICPRRVLACSMDTSCNRDAIAILMDGRMGLVCAVTGNTNRSGRAANVRDLRRMQEQPDVFPVSRGGSWRKNVSLGTSHSPRSYYAFSDQHLRFSVLASDPFGVGDSLDAEAENNHLDYHYYPLSRRQHAAYPTLMSPSYPMPIEASPPTLYALLCSADDPPRSVALCPQRRCVAFGCSSGIELHWVDALTGEDLNRWFPLTAPSDYLYFLPPRTGVDSAKKLRLVSSQGTPGERASVGERFSGRKKSGAFYSVHGDWNQNELFMDADGEAESSRGRTRNGSDHYRAVPLSDGYHLLFTDPASGVLCLGNDAPLGGPTKLLRKLWFSGPVGEGSPVAYAAASDLRCGVRVIAAYGLGKEQSIWLFSVPGDIFTHSYGRSEASYGPGFPSGADRDAGRGSTDWIPWWGNDGGGLLEWPSLGYGGSMSTMWPAQVRGQEIGQCADVADVAIHTGPGIGETIWAFGRRGVALTWTIDDGTPYPGVRQRFVVRDGTVREADADGDVEMCDVHNAFPPGPEPGIPSPTQPQQEQFDGAAPALEPWQGQLPARRRRRRSSFERDADGDVVMTAPDLPLSQPAPDREDRNLRRYAEFADGSFESVAMARAGKGGFVRALGKPLEVCFDEAGREARRPRLPGQCVGEEGFARGGEGGGE